MISKYELIKTIETYYLDFSHQNNIIFSFDGTSFETKGITEYVNLYIKFQGTEFDITKNKDFVTGMIWFTIYAGTKQRAYQIQDLIQQDAFSGIPETTTPKIPMNLTQYSEAYNLENGYYLVRFGVSFSL